MCRRRTVQLIAAALVAAVAGCSAQPATPSATATSQRAAGTAEAASPTTPARASEPAPPGVAPRRAFGVGVRTLRLNRGGDRPLPVTLWYPAESGSPQRPGSNARVADGRFPVVLFSHGLTGLPADYRALLTRWVAAGFVVVAPAYPHTSRGVGDLQVLDVINQPADASYVLTKVLALDTTAEIRCADGWPPTGWRRRGTRPEA